MSMVTLGVRDLETSRRFYLDGLGSSEMGMVTFDQSLFGLFENGLISYEDAIKNADSQNELRLRIKLDSKRAKRNLMEDEFVKGLKVEKKEEAGQIMRR